MTSLVLNPVADLELVARLLLRLDGRYEAFTLLELARLDTLLTNPEEPCDTLAI